MAPGSKDVRAGRAFVEVYADRTRLNNDLRTIQRQMRSFGAGLISTGKWMTAVGGSIVAPLLAATKHFMTIGSELVDMSARTGVSTNALGELGYAAEQTGSSVESLEKGIRLMHKTIDEASKGGKAQINALASIGLSIADIQAMNPERQFEAIGNAIASIEDPTRRAATMLELLGRGSTSLLPMFAEGSEGLARLRKEAIELGMSIGPEQAADADRLSDAWNRLTTGASGVSIAIGSILSPMMEGFAKKLQEGIIAYRKYVEENRDTVIVSLAVGAALIGVGVALVFVGKAITLFSGALTLVQKLWTGFGVGLKVVMALFGALTHPITLIAVGLSALGGYLLYASGSLDKAASYIGTAFKQLWADVSETFTLMADTMAAGDFVAAAKLGWALVKLEWVKVSTFFSTWFNEHLGSWETLILNIAKLWIKLRVWIVNLWSNLQIMALEQATKPISEFMYRQEHGKRPQGGHYAYTDITDAMKQDKSFSALDKAKWTAGVLAHPFDTAEQRMVAEGFNEEQRIAIEKQYNNRVAAWREYDATEGKIVDDVVAREIAARKERQLKEAEAGGLTIAELNKDIARVAGTAAAEAKAKADISIAQKELDDARINAKRSIAEAASNREAITKPGLALPDIAMAGTSKTTGTFSAMALALSGPAANPIVRAIEKEAKRKRDVDRIAAQKMNAMEKAESERKRREERNLRIQEDILVQEKRLSMAMDR
jgi:hypothetical protein